MRKPSLASPYLALCLTALLLASCRTTAESSKSQHTVGDVTDPAPLDLICKRDQYLPSPEDEAFYRYLDDMLAFVIKANEGILPKDLRAQLCPSITPLFPYKVNAASAAGGVIYAYRGILWVVENDAQFASIFAHELAHAVSNHVSAAANHPELRKNPEYQKILQGIRGVQKKITARNEGHDGQPREALLLFLIENLPEDQTPTIGAFINLMSSLASKNIELHACQGPVPKKFSAQLLRELPFDPINRGIAKRSDESELIFRGIEDLRRIVQDKRLDLTLTFSAEQLTKMEALETAAFQDIDRELCESTEFANLTKAKRRWEETYLGPDVAANWQEQDADEKGQELMVRAGLDPSETDRWFENLESYAAFVDDSFEVPEKDRKPLESASLAPADLTPLIISQIADHVGPSCERGRASHPNTCWRIENLKQERLQHAASYQKIWPGPLRTTVFPGRLQQLQQHYFTVLPKDLAKAAKKP